MMKVIHESGIDFGRFDTDKLYEIEKSKINLDIGKGIKTVEFIYLNGTDLLFVEAKATCPNPANKDSSDAKNKKYEAYFSDIAEKFIDSVSLFASIKLGRQIRTEEFGRELSEADSFRNIALKLVLVIAGAEESCLPGPKAELESRLLKWRKIWKADVVVLNRKLAKAAGISR